MNSIFELILQFSTFILMISVLCCFIRMILGETFSDRVIALDLTAYLLISLIAIFSISSDQSIYIDVIISIVFIVFLSTVAFAHYIEWQIYHKLKRRNPNDDDR